MHDVPRPRSLRSLLVASVAVLVTAQVGWSGAARAEDGPPGPMPGDTVVGRLVQAWPEHDDPAGAVAHADEGPLTWVETPDGAAVRVETEDLEDVARAEVGATVVVTLGELVADGHVAAGVEPAHDVLAASVTVGAQAAPLPSAAAGTVTDPVTVVMAVPRGAAADSQPMQQLVDTVDGPVSAYWAEQSDGAVTVRVTSAVDLRSAPTVAGCADPVGMWNEIAERVGWSRAPGRHLLVHVPAGAPDCGPGLAEVGASRGAGGRLYVRSSAPSVIAHELGHNFGLGHSSGLRCDGQVEAGACEVAGYDDWYDVMGISWGETGSLNTPQAARLGLLPASEQVAVSAATGSATHTLAPVGAPSGTRAIRLDAGGAVYWLEYRAATGQDSWLAVPARNWPGLQAQVTVRRSAEGADTSLLLDATPVERARWGADRRAGLTVGQPVSLAAGRFTVTVLDAGVSARVRVDTGDGGAAAGATAVGDVGGSGSTYFLDDALSGRAQTVFVFGDHQDTVYTGDWDGNGTDTLAVRRQNSYFLRNSNSSGPATIGFTYGDPGDVVHVGDWDGNGTDTLMVRRGNTFFVKNDTRTGVADVVFTYGDPGDVVLVGDWDGDGDDTLAVRRGATYHMKDDVTTGVADRVLGYGEPTDTVLVGRWSAGAGSALAVRRGNTYFLKYALTSGVADRTFAYGDPTDTAFVGDFDGDGVDGLGVRRAGR